MDTPNTFVTTIDLKLADKLRDGLLNNGFEITVLPHTLFAGKKKGVSCALYESGKLVVQGKDKGQFIEFYLEPEILGTFTYTHPQATIVSNLDLTGRIGIDESGKGDFFGPLCIAGIYAEGKAIGELKALGVQDSKEITDAGIIKIGKQIKAHYQHHIVKINPQKYNELYTQFANLNKLLAWGHATTIEQLVLATGCTNIIIDQFAAEHVVITALKRKKLEITLTQRHRAEEDLVVAAASILARQTFLEGLEQLGREFSIELPKGASQKTISMGRALVRKHGPEVLGRLGKLHFKTLDAILGNTSE